MEQDKYHQNLKVYRDLLNSFDTANQVGFVGWMQVMITGLTVEEIKALP